MSSIYERERNATTNVAARIVATIPGASTIVDACVIRASGPDWSATLIVSCRPTDAGSRTVRFRGAQHREVAGPFLGPAGTYGWRMEMVEALTELVARHADSGWRLRLGGQ